jgi:hypothetical protein
MTRYLNRVKQLVSTGGSGTPIALGAKYSNASLTMDEAGAANGDVISYVITDGNDFEVQEDQTYTTSGASLTRGTPKVSSIAGVVGTTKLTLSGTAVMVCDITAGNLNGLISSLFAQSFTTAQQAQAQANIGLPSIRRNVLLNGIYQSKAFAGYRRAINAFYDGYKASDGINAGSSSLYAVNTTLGYVVPDVAPNTINTGGGAVNLQNYTMVSRDTAVLNGVTVTKIGVYSTTVNSTFALKLVKRNSANNYDVVVNQAFSHGGTGWEDMTLTTPYVVPGSGTYYLAAWQNNSNPNAATGARAYLLANMTGTGQTTTGEDTGNNCYPLRYGYSTSLSNMTVVTTAQVADASSSNVRAMVEFDAAATPVGGTDFKIEASCDGGAHYTFAATYTVVTTHSQGGRSVVETDDIACTAGTSIQLRLTSLTNKLIPFYGVGAEWH